MGVSVAHYSRRDAQCQSAVNIAVKAVKDLQRTTGCVTVTFTVVQKDGEHVAVRSSFARTANRDSGAALFFENPEWRVTRHEKEIPIRGQKFEIVFDRELCKKRINCSNLKSLPATDRL
jgi:hypothetical protein